MIAVVVSLVAVVLLVLVVVALGMRSMSRRESSLPPERLKEMAEKEEKTQTRSTDEFASHEPRMRNFSPDFSPIDEVKQKPVRTGQRGKRGVDEWGGGRATDDDDEAFWANIRSDAEEGNFGAGGTVAARKGASRPVERERPAEREHTGEAARQAERQSGRRSERTSGRQGERTSERPAKRSDRSAKPQPAAAAAVDPDATTIQGPLPQRQPAAASANLADLVEPQKRAPSQSELADQRTMTFAAPTPGDVMSILGPGAQPVPAPTRPEPSPASLSSNNGVSNNNNGVSGNGSHTPSRSSRRKGSRSRTPAAQDSGSFPATPAANGSGSFPAVSPTSSGNFPAAPTAAHPAPTSDPFPAYGGGASDPLGTSWNNQPAATTSGSWPASPDIFDDPAPAAAPYSGATSWPAFEQPAARGSYPSSYEVSSGWAVADDSDPLAGPSPASGTPTVPGRAVSNYDVLSAPTPPQQAASPFAAGAYETGDITTSPAAAAAWPAPPAPGNGAQGGWPAQAAYGEQPQPQSGSHRRAPEQDFPHDYYR
ncbi:hypothetical protein AB0I81_45760 [Nonomuraea sp. NPDC050404]|uniref:hypothetical protein n=1 Tax=Nonomuraea sp. NPDC050404 TaxID=3155783 RepID=UPI0033D0158D